VVAAAQRRVLLPQVQLERPDACLDALLVFSLVWSVGGACDRPSAAAFDAFLRRLLAGGVAVKFVGGELQVVLQ
jgi:hypothetical protein